MVYAKRPFAGPQAVLAYLARYTHRVAISNSRLVAMTDDEVVFRYKDCRCDGARTIIRLSAHEFIRRFLRQVLPDGFHRIRHYGFLAKGDSTQALEQIRAVPTAKPTRDQIEAPEATTAGSEPACLRNRVATCPEWGGLIRRLDRISPVQTDPFHCNTS